MCPVVDNPGSCEIHAVIRFLHAKIMSTVEIHCELCMVYGQNIMSEETVRQWCRMFKDGWANVHNEEWSVRPSVVSDDLVQSVDEKICERRGFTISELSCEFLQISHTALYEIMIVRPGYHKFCTRWVPRMLTGVHKTQRMASALTLLEWYHKDGDKFPNHSLRVTDDEIWVSFVNVGTKEQSKQWMHTHSPNKPIKCKQMSARKRMATVFWDRKGGIHATRDHNNVKSVLWNTKKTA
jgi:transposase